MGIRLVLNTSLIYGRCVLWGVRESGGTKTGGKDGSHPAPTCLAQAMLERCWAGQIYILGQAVTVGYVQSQQIQNYFTLNCIFKIAPAFFFFFLI